MKKTEIICLLDRSGSMQRIASDMEGGFKTFIEKQKEVEGKARVTLAKFDDAYELVYEGKPLEDIHGLELEPRNSTALFDAIGFTLSGQRERIKKEGWAELVIFAIITDGKENASKEYTGLQIKQLIKEAEADGWEFIYMGANQDSMVEATNMGMKAGSGRNYNATGQGVREMYETASDTTTSHRTR